LHSEFLRYRTSLVRCAAFDKEAGRRPRPRVTPGHPAVLPTNLTGLPQCGVAARGAGCLKEMDMKKVLIIAAGLACAFAWQAHAQDASTPNTAQAQPTAADAVGGQPSTMSMSGGPAHAQGLTRAEVLQQLEQSQKSGEAARLQELFRGGN
jgi:hypothetical protein